VGDRAAAQSFFSTACTAVHEVNNPNRFNHSYQLFASACLTDPTWAEAYYQAGNNCSDLEYKEAAVANYRRALECEMPDDAKGRALTNLGWKTHQLGRTREALEYSLEAVKYNINEPYAWINLSCIYQTLRDSKKGLECAREALKRAPDDPTVKTQYAFGLLFDRRFASGLKAFEARFEYELKNFLQFPYPRWKGEEGKTVYLISDQGLGDTLSYARFVREVCRRSKYVHAFVHPELLRTFNHAFIDIQNLNLTPNTTPFPPADYWSTFVSLPFALDLSDDEIRNTPPVQIPIYTVPYNWKIPDRKLHVGIAWAGSPLNKLDVHRNIPVQQFFDLCRVPGLQMYSLQVGDRRSEVHERGGSSFVGDLVPYIRDVVDTVSLMQHLDLVIGCESALGHICSCVDKEFWLPYSWMGRDYRVGVDGVDRLWTPRHRIFLQGEDMNWQPVFTQIVEALKERLDESRDGLQRDREQAVAGQAQQKDLGPRLVAAR
jgi:Tfp pilus assembly protein PilF